MPWNFPYYQVARFAAPNLMLGNTILLKHAPSCPQSALLMEEIFVAAGLPADAYVNVFATNDQVADMIADPRIQGVSLTGSRAGRRRGRRDRRPQPEEGRPRARRLRRVHRARHRRHGRHRQGRDPRPDVQHRPGLQRRQAVHGPRAVLRRVRRQAHRSVRGDGPRRPDGPQDRDRPAVVAGRGRHPGRAGRERRHRGRHPARRRPGGRRPGCLRRSPRCSPT